MIIKVAQNQTIWDIALQYAGSVEAALDILEANGKADTTLFVGEELLVPKVINRRVATFFESEAAVANSLEPLSEDTWVAPAPACLPAYYQILFNGFVVDSGTLASGELSQINIDEYANQWQRHPLWPPIPDTPDRAYIVWAVFDGEIINGIETTINATTSIDYGDGNTSTTAAAIKTHSYNYAAIIAPVLQSYDGRNYKPVLITIEVTSGNPTDFFINNNTSNFPNNTLQVVDRLTNSTGRKQYRLSPTDSNILTSFNNRSAVYLEAVTLNHQLTQSFAAFSGARNLMKFEVPPNFFVLIGTSQSMAHIFNRCFKPGYISFDSGFFGSIGVTGNFTNVFNLSGIKKIGDLVMTAQTSFNSAFRESEIEEIGNIVLSGTTSMIQTFQNTKNLRKIGTINVPTSVTAIQNCFNGSGVSQIIFINSLSNVTAAASAFTNNGNITRLVLPGFRLGFDISGNRMQASDINETLTSLGTANGGQTINVANNPGSLTCNPSIATAKGYTVITV